MYTYDPKPFDKQLYNKNDEIGNNYLKSIVESHGYIFKRNKDIYAIDAEIYKNERFVCYMDAEVNHEWYNQYPYNEVHIWSRKYRMFIECEKLGKLSFFFTCNHNQSKYIITPGFLFNHKDCHEITIYPKNRPSGDKVICIPFCNDIQDDIKFMEIL